MSDIGNTTQTCPLTNKKKVKEGPIEPPPKSIRVSLFFDGTFNNRMNAKLGKLIKDRPDLQLEKPEGSDSYDSDVSNISKIEECWEKDTAADFSFSLYIEGIGTESYKKDNIKHGASGMGSTGVVAKVEKGINSLINKTANLGIVKKKIKYIYLDVFGFSRGAAAARYFIYAALINHKTKIEDTLIAQGFTIEGEIKVKFVGLFDTVASYGIAHWNDTTDLHLDSISLAERVVQLAAAEEHRVNFRLTNINSASNGTQIFLPGVHADIGGSYKDDDSENLILNSKPSGIAFFHYEKKRLEEEKTLLIKKGWYKKYELEVHGSLFSRFTLTCSRKNISNKYSLIPLNIMGEFAKNAGLNLNLDNFPVPAGFLSTVKTKLDKYISNNSANSSPDHWINNNSDYIKLLRHDYLHFSAFYSKGMIMGVVNPHKPESNRVRIIQNG